MADCVADGWQGVALPRSAPADVLERVNAAIRAAMATAEVQRQLGTTGAEHEPLSVAQCAELVRRENGIWRPLIRDLGFRLDRLTGSKAGIRDEREEMQHRRLRLVSGW